MPPQFSATLSYPNNTIVLTILSTPTPLSPSSFQGKTLKNRFLSQTDIINVLKWSPPVDSAGIVSYQISRDGVVIADVPVLEPNVYYDPNRKKNTTYIYTIVSLDANGAKSSPLSIALKS